MELATNQSVSFRIPAWISFRTYLTDVECRAIVSNECTHQTVFLEGASAAVWKMIEDGASSINDLLEQAKSANLDLSHADFSEFTTMLYADGFIADPQDCSRYERISKEPPRTERIENSPLLNEMNDFIRWMGRNNFLYSVHWEITWRCNEKCIHCYNPGAAHFDDEKPERETDELTLEQIHKVLLDLKEIGVAKITYSGGDPFVRRDFFDVLAITRKLGFAVDVYTNALLLRPEAMERLLELYPSCVGVSVYSANPQAHDEITKVPGSFNKSVAALRQLKNLGVRTAMKSIQMRHTVHGWRKAALLADELGAGAEIDFGLTAGADGSN